MSHWITKSGRVYVECDNRIGSGRCGRRAFGRRDSQKAGPSGMVRLIAGRAGLSICDLPAGWAVAPYPDDFDHMERCDAPWMIGPSSTTDAIPRAIRGDVHTCPACVKARR